MSIRTEESFNGEALLKMFKHLGNHNPLFVVGIILAVAKSGAPRMKARKLVEKYFPTAALSGSYAELYVSNLCNEFRAHRARLYSAWCRRNRLPDHTSFDMSRVAGLLD